MMARSSRTKPVTVVQARQYLMKAEEFLAVAEDCLVADRLRQATLFMQRSTLRTLSLGPGCANVPLLRIMHEPLTSSAKRATRTARSGRSPNDESHSRGET